MNTTKDEINYDEVLLKEEILNALENRNSNNKIILDKISLKNAKKIERIIGINVIDRRQVLYDNDIRHMLLEHQNQKIEKNRNQIAISIDDIIKILL